MRYLYLLIAAVFLTAASVSAQGTLSPASPVVNQGASTTISCTANCGTGGAWTLPGGAGTLSGATATTVTYTAPAVITPQQSAGGYQVRPNNDVFNTDISGLSLRSDSATLMAGTGSNRITYGEVAAFPINYCDASTPLQSMVFLYTPGNNGNFQIPAYPGVKIESGWFTRWDGNRDHHLICIDTSNGTIQEEYQHRKSLTTTAASVTGNVATLTFASDPSVTGAGFVVGQAAPIDGFTGADTFFNQASGVALTAVTTSTVSYALTHANASASSNGMLGTIVDCPSAGLDTCNSAGGIRYLNSTYNLPNAQGGGTDAAGLPLVPLMLRLQEIEQAIATGGSINHALRMTLRNNFICNSSTANACYSGQPGGSRHIWPATAEAFVGGGVNPYGARYRLKAAFNISTFSPIAQILLTQLKNYGLILSDGGTDWSVIGEATKWPLSIKAAFDEIAVANIIGSSNFEVIDEGGLRISDTSSETTSSRETVTYTSSTGVATVDVALMGVAVNLPNDALYFQDGLGATQLTALANIGTVTWTMDNPVGTLTSGGSYTPPATDGTFTLEVRAQGGDITGIIEDKNVAATGSYNATSDYAWNPPGAAVHKPYEWQMYMLALKSASAPYGAPPVQFQVGGIATCSNTCTDGFSVNATSGNLGVIAVYGEDATATISSTSFACGTMTLDSNSPKRGAASSMWVYTVQLTSSACGANSIGITFNHSIVASISTTEYHNMAAASVVDCSGAGSATSFTMRTTPCSTSNANDTIWSIGIIPVGYNLGIGALFKPGGYYTTVTATSTTNAAIAASMTLVTLPPGTIRLRPGAITQYTDSASHPWFPTGGSGGNVGCCGDLSSGPWPAVTDIAEYYYQEGNYGDEHFDFYVPNGAYQIRGKFGTSAAVGGTIDSLDAQGILSVASADINTAAGGTYKPVDYVLSATVTDGLLHFTVRNSPPSGSSSGINAIQIDRTGVAVATTLTPGMKVTSGTSMK